MPTLRNRLAGYDAGKCSCIGGVALAILILVDARGVLPFQ